jgi:hypothetical protein
VFVKVKTTKLFLVSVKHDNNTSQAKEVLSSYTVFNIF